MSGVTLCDYYIFALTPHLSEIVPMDWRAMSRSRSRVPMDWRPSSRSRSRPPPAMGVQLDNVLSHPERSAFPYFEQPFKSNPSDLHGLFSLAVGDKWDPRSPGSTPSATDSLPIGPGPHSPTSSTDYATFPLPTLHEHTSHSRLPAFPLGFHGSRYSYLTLPYHHSTYLHTYEDHPSSLSSFGAHGLSESGASEQRSFPKNVRKTSFDHTVSKDGILASISGRHQVNGRPQFTEALIGTKRRADAPHAESMLRADTPSFHSSSRVESLDVLQRHSLSHHHPPSNSHHPSNGSFPSAPFNFTVPGYGGLFSMHPAHPLPHDYSYSSVLAAVDGSRHAVPSYPAPNEGLSAVSAVVAESYAHPNATRPVGVDYSGMEYPNMIGMMYANSVEAANPSYQSYTHVDPTQILLADHGENGFMSLHPSPGPSNDRWGGYGSSTAAYPERRDASTPPSAECLSSRQGIRKIASTKRIQEAVVRSTIARKRSTAGPDSPLTAQLRSSTSTPGLTSATSTPGLTSAMSTPDPTSTLGGRGPKGEDEETGSTICTNCQTTNTPLWRRDPEGEPLCT